MKLDFDEQDNQLTISSYGNDGITVGPRKLDIPFVLCGNEIYTDRLPPSPSEIDSTHLDRLIELDQSIILIGTGSQQLLLDDAVLHTAYAAGVGVEVMTTPAACRCYNVLIGENRALLAALYML